MAEKINIVELDMDTEALTKKASDVRANLLEISAEISQLKKNFKDGNISVNEYTEKLTTLTAVQKENQKELRVYDAMLQANIGSDKHKVKQNSLLIGSIREIGTALSQNKQAYANLTEAERENEDIGGKLLKTIQEQDKKYKELQKSMGNTQVEVGNYKEEVKEALAEHYGLDAQVNRLADSLGVFKTASLSAWGSIKSFVVGNQEAVKSLYDTETGARKASQAKALWIKATNGTSLALKILRGALVSTGIGAIVVVLGSLIAYLTSTQEGINKVSSVLTPLKQVFATIWGVIQNVGKALFDVFTKTSVIKDYGNMIKNIILFPINQIIASVKALGKVLKGDFGGAWDEFTGPMKESVKSAKKLAQSSVEAGKQIAGAFEGVGNKMKEAWERGKKIHELEKELEEMNINYKRQTDELNRKFREQKEIAGDITKSYEERRKAAQNAIDLQNQIIVLAEKRNGLEVDLIKLKQQANDTDNAGKKELQDKLAELENEKSANIKKRAEANNQLNNINKEASAEAKKRIEADIEAQKKQIEHYVKTNSAVAQSLQERLSIEEKAKDDRLAILEKERKIGNISKEEYERQKYNIENDYLKTRAELSIEASQRELAQYEALNQSKIDKETQLTTELIAQEQLRITSIYERKVQALEQEKQLKQKAHDWDYNAEAEHQIKLQELKQAYDEEYNETSKELKATFDQQQSEKNKQRQALEFEEKLISLQEQNASQWEIEAEMLKQKHIQEDQALQEKYQKGIIDHDTYLRMQQVQNKKQAQAEKELKQKTEEAKLQMTLGALGQAKQIFGEHTAVGKAAAIAEATINTYLGVTKALTLPPPMSFITAGTTLAMGLKNIQKIGSTNVKFQKGGLVKGRSHAEGGVPFSVQGQGGYEMEGGEYIINKQATIKYFPLLETLNKSTNGYTAPRPKFFGYGGLVNGATSMTKIDMSDITTAVREGAMLGTFDGAKSGTEQGSMIGSRQGSLEGSMQGSYQGATFGTNQGLYESSLRISDIKNSKTTSLE